ncbi:MAG: tetraacyldisaccharide 4'-kinase [Proteobacteria bacterium]|nr:tetraacyldisaccharide 4'-kinase [Pseudomonadota bacterium]
MNSPSFWWLPNSTLPARLLQPLSFIYKYLASLHGQLRAARAYYASVPVISVGNLTLGGAGKTPVTIWLAEHFSSEGHQVAIVSRGYGGTETDQPLQVNPAQHTAAQVGDEPLEMAHRFTSQPVMVWVGKNRPAAVKRAEQAGATLILLDDGFQRRDISRQINILVINGANPFGNGLPLPAGPLREDLSAARRASFAIVLNEPSNKINTFYGVEAYRLSITPTPQSLAALKGPLLAFAGIAHPQKFFKTLKDQNLNVLETHPYPDHHRYTRSQLAFLHARAQSLGASLVTTAKDATKLPRHFAHVLTTTLTGEDTHNIIEELNLRLR